MQAKLPDVNGAIVRHRNASLLAYDQKDYAKAAISLNAIISLLPDEYKVTVNTDKYMAAVSAKHTISCRYCTVEYEDKETKEKTTVPAAFEIESIVPYTMYLSSIDSLFAHSKTMQVWKCPKCNEVQPFAGSKQKMIMNEKPYYTGIIPEPPRRHGLYDRVGFGQKFKVWFSVAVQEIEKKIGEYRRDYIMQQSDSDIEKYSEFFEQEEQDESEG